MACLLQRFRKLLMYSLWWMGSEVSKMKTMGRPKILLWRHEKCEYRDISSCKFSFVYLFEISRSHMVRRSASSQIVKRFNVKRFFLGGDSKSSYNAHDTGVIHGFQRPGSIYTTKIVLANCKGLVVGDTSGA